MIMTSDKGIHAINTFTGDRDNVTCGIRANPGDRLSITINELSKSQNSQHLEFCLYSL
jgi:hypothetical protein